MTQYFKVKKPNMTDYLYFLWSIVMHIVSVLHVMCRNGMNFT